MGMKHRKKALRKLQSHFAKLPLELRQEIYEYVLVAEKPILALDEDKTEPVYVWEENSEEEAQECKIGLDFLVWNSISDWQDAYAFFFRNNTFEIQTRYMSEFIVKEIQELCEAGYPAHMKGLIVDIPCDALSAESKSAGYLTDFKDYDEDDNGEPDLPAFCMLKPLLQFERLGRLKIIIRDVNKDWEMFVGSASRIETIERTALAVSKLCERVVSTSKAPRLEISFRERSHKGWTDRDLIIQNGFVWFENRDVWIDQYFSPSTDDEDNVSERGKLGTKEQCTECIRRSRTYEWVSGVEVAPKREKSFYDLWSWLYLRYSIFHQYHQLGSD
ncbi:hypothetical protein MMC10_000580 [Thelotrema lepadinum]|nr:hypothetical protein [Thelotrema lepadinum]